jgi:acetylornithine deacetylase/succinyl-diaminopimelate desuccinylase-like protein
MILNPQQLIHDLAPDYENFLADLVACYSPLGQEFEVQELVRYRMEKIGLEIVHVENSGTSNLCGILRGSDGNAARSLILGAHCDVAPVDVPGRWTYPPYRATVIDRVMYGRGVLDDKAGIAVIMMIAEAIVKSQQRPKGDILFQSVAGDETSGLGTQALVTEGYVADGTIICDGTWPLRIIRGHLGQLFLDVEIQGDPFAACVEDRGTNPILIATEYIRRLRSVIDGLANNHPPPEGLNRTFFCNIGSIHSGAWHGSVPVSAILQIQIGFWVGTCESIFELAQQIAHETSDRIKVNKGSLEVAPFETHENTELITILRDAITRNQHQAPKVLLVTGHCDLQYFGISNVCLYGPGGGKSPHGIDECYFLDDMPIVAHNLLNFIETWCQLPKTITLKR